MTQINSVGANPIVVANGGTGAATLTSGGVLIGAGTSAVSATLTPSGLTSLSANTLTAAAGNVTLTNGNTVYSTSGTGPSFTVTNSSVASGNPATCNGRVGSATFTGPSTATNADSSFVINNTSITSNTQLALVTMSGATTGSALSIKSITMSGSGHTMTIVVTNGDGAAIVTSVADITFNFMLLT